jgi:hypothetical protein
VAGSRVDVLPRRRHRRRGAATIIRRTGGNLRLGQRLFVQIARVLAVNRLQTITREVVAAAREQLVIEPPP